MPVKSLYRLASAACIKNIRNIDDIGDAPYHVMRPVLLKVENAKQLREIEENCPQICGADEELWRAFIKRDVPREVLAENNIEPKDPKNWWKVYRRLKKLGDEVRQQKEDELKAVLNQKSQEKQDNKMTYISKVIDPRKSARTTSRPTIFSRGADQSSLTFGSGSRTSTATGRGMLLKAKREARENSLFSARKNVLSTPTHLLAGSGGRQPPFPVQRPTAPPNVTVRASPSNAAQTTATRPQVAGASSGAAPQPFKRPASSVFMSSKRRKV